MATILMVPKCHKLGILMDILTKGGVVFFLLLIFTNELYINLKIKMITTLQPCFLNAQLYVARNIHYFL